MPESVRVAVLASGGGSNLQALLDRFHAVPEALAQIALVVGGRPGIGALSRAKAAGVADAVLAPGSENDEAGALLALLARHRIDLVVLAGYLRRVPAAVVEHFAGRMVNVHPALLPAFGGSGMYGLRIHRAVLAAGVRVSGATVHRVEHEYDTGEILAQWPVPVFPGDTPERLAERVLAVEHRLLPAVVGALAGGATAPPPFSEAFVFGRADAPAPEEVIRLMPPLSVAAPRRL